MCSQKRQHAKRDPGKVALLIPNVQSAADVFIGEPARPAPPTLEVTCYSSKELRSVTAQSEAQLLHLVYLRDAPRQKMIEGELPRVTQSELNT